MVDVVAGGRVVEHMMQGEKGLWEDEGREEESRGTNQN